MRVGKLYAVVCLCVVFALPAFAGVTVSSPGSGATVGSPVHFVAGASSPACSKGVASIGIYTSPGVLAYKVNGSSLDTYLSMSSGTHYPVVQEWDNCGWSATAQLTISVSGSNSSGGKTFSNLQKNSGWTGYALVPPSWGICSSCTSSGPQLKWSWTANISTPSMDSISTKTVYGGGTQWADVLWNNHLIGDFSSQGLLDWNHTLVPSLHNFTYDVYFWVGNASVSQAMEFDINQFVGGKSYIWGHECRIAGGHEWDTWNNQTQHWVKSGIPCKPLSNAWNHLILNVQRTSGGHLLFHSITLNGNPAFLDRYDTPTSTNWYGITINYQLDGNSSSTPYTVFLDKLNFTVQ